MAEFFLDFEKPISELQNKIAELENITATEEDVEAELQRIADAYQMKIEDVRNAVPVDSVAEDIKVKKAMDLVKKKAITK